MKPFSNLKGRIFKHFSFQCHGFHHRLTRCPNHSVLLSHRSWSSKGFSVELIITLSLSWFVTDRFTDCGHQSWVNGWSNCATGLPYLRRLQLHASQLQISGVSQKSQRGCGKSLRLFCVFNLHNNEIEFQTDALWNRRRRIWSGPSGESLGSLGVLS